MRKKKKKQKQKQKHFSVYLNSAFDNCINVLRNIIVNKTSVQRSIRFYVLNFNKKCVLGWEPVWLGGMGCVFTSIYMPQMFLSVSIIVL